MLLLATLTALALPQSTDTTVAAQRGARLSVNNYGGEVRIRTWNESRVRIRADHSSRDRIDVSAGPSVISVESSGRMGPSHMVEYEITVPAWMAVSVEGVYVDIDIAGVQADVSTETVEGDVVLQGGNGSIDLTSVEGSITVTGARGRIRANSIESDVRLTNVNGEITAETVDGDIIIDGAESSAVEASSTDGDILYIGTIKDGGRYALITHDGDVSIAVPEGTNATFTVATFDGSVDASFPMSVNPGQVDRKRRYSFKLGSGSARVELESFDGDLLLRRPGELRAPRDSDHEESMKHKPRDHYADY